MSRAGVYELDGDLATSPLGEVGGVPQPDGAVKVVQRTATRPSTWPDHRRRRPTTPSRSAPRTAARAAPDGRRLHGLRQHPGRAAQALVHHLARDRRPLRRGDPAADGLVGGALRRHHRGQRRPDDLLGVRDTATLSTRVGDLRPPADRLLPRRAAAAGGRLGRQRLRRGPGHRSSTPPTAPCSSTCGRRAAPGRSPRSGPGRTTPTSWWWWRGPDGPSSAWAPTVPGDRRRAAGRRESTAVILRPPPEPAPGTVG